ncbi:phage holin family protein [Capnocytophaga sp.]|uniref:phage holin family protein n=1 Tax=Capnocytophaga sp. TaxID=44737 RepID=UPI0026DCAF63|nr:phage holin family protein [Capnocytophaga sp.]MDO5105413.1 phage holin family protein [Capnocytophaga sp.]
MKYILSLFITGIIVFLLGNILPGAAISDYFSAVLVAFVLSILDVLVKPVLQFISIPITVITLGFFLFVINALIILLAAELVSGFRVNGFWGALLFSLCLSLVQSVAFNLMKDDKSRN